MGFDPGFPGSRPGPKAGAKLLHHPGIPWTLFMLVDFSVTMINRKHGSRGILKAMNLAFNQFHFGQPQWRSGLASPAARGVILETWDGVPCQAPCVEPASLSACVSVSLCVSLVNK